MSMPPPERDGIPFACVLGAWREHESELLAFLRHRVGDAHLAEDLLQDVFVKAMRQGQAFCRIENPRAWLFQVARNGLIDDQRTRHPGESLPDDIALPEDVPAPIDALAACIERVLPDLDEADRDVIRPM